MYLTLLFLHSLFRWLALAGLLYALLLSVNGWLNHSAFTPLHDRVRHWSATIVHLQFAIGMLLYFQAPRVDVFFRILHPLLMFSAVVLVTLGSSFTKRRKNDRQKFRTWTTFYLIALALIFFAIPWPFAPWAPRPFLRTF